MKSPKQNSAAPLWALPLAIAILAGTGIGASFNAIAIKPASDVGLAQHHPQLTSRSAERHPTTRALLPQRIGIDAGGNRRQP
jgi:hypothetical protein